MTATQGLYRNAGSLLVSRVVMAALGWAGSLLIVRDLSTEDFGRFTFVFSVLGMLSIVTDMGTGRVAVAGFLADPERSGAFAGSYVVLRSLMGVAGYLAALVFVIAGGYEPQIVRATAVAGLVVVFATPSSAYSLAFQAHLKLPRVAVVNTVGQLVQLSLVVLVAVRGGSLVLFAIPSVVGEVVILLLTVPLARRLVRFRYRPQPAEWVAMLREAVPLSIGTALATLYYRVDSVMLSWLDDFDGIGAYGIAYKFADLVHFVSAAVAAPILTLFVRAWPDQLGEFRATLRRGAAFLGFAGGLVVVATTVAADEAIGLLYGARYELAGDATRLLVLAESISFFSTLGFSCLLAAGRNRAYPLITLAGLALNVALNAVVIPRWSFEGAAVTTLVTEAVVVTLMWREVLELPGLRPLELGPLTRLVPAVALSLAAGLAVLAAGPWWVAVAVAVGTYLVLADRSGALGERGLRSLVDEGAGHLGDGGDGP